MSIQIQENVALAPLTTMRAGGTARFFVGVTSSEEAIEAMVWAQTHQLPVFILGGGSNVLVPDFGFAGLVMSIRIKGIEYQRNVKSVCVMAGAGEKWDDLVHEVVSRNLWGIENLSLIPGTVGGAVVQNIGAYGAEVCECVEWVEAIDMLTMKIKKFSRDECMFGYRESIFKKNKKLMIIRVALHLSDNGILRTSYEDIKKYFTEKNIVIPTLRSCLFVWQRCRWRPSVLQVLFLKTRLFQRSNLKT
jgi:UDP-N-acetylmuramate dehydrogenase